MRYREHPIPADLSAIVEVLWTLEAAAPGPGESAAQPVIPDGRSEIVLHWGDRFERGGEDGRFIAQPMAIVAGQLREPLVLRPTGVASMLGIRLRPAGAAALWTGPQVALAGRTLDAGAVSPAVERWLIELRDGCRTPDEAAGLVAAGLRRLARPARVDQRVAAAAARIQHHAGTERIDAVAAHVGMTRRHLERGFLDQVGLTPKRLARIARLQRALGVLSAAAASGAVRPGLEAAVASGYADEAHFARDCRALAGTTPARHAAHVAALTGAFLEDAARDAGRRPDPGARRRGADAEGRGR
ncbi:MAG: helix-turn-helix transcriptional regulator [Vicinamibacterales bacterium]